MRGDYYFLSNFYPCKIVFDGLVFDNSESLFQSFKCKEIKDREKFVNKTGVQAKRIGRRVQLVNNWEDIKVKAMTKAVVLKFIQHPELVEKLLLVDEPIIEHNNHRDTEWGVYNGVGKNKLGNIIQSFKNYLEDNDNFKKEILSGRYVSKDK